MLTREIAKTIVIETSLRLNRNVNIMNHHGVIIASGNTTRIDHIHEGALEVLKQQEPLKIFPNEDGKWRGSQPGLNLPISFQDQIVGVIGITGNPDDMEDVGGVVKMATELMIKQEYIASQMEWKQRTKEMVIEELIKADPSFEHVNRGLNLLGITLSPPYITYIIQMTERRISNTALIKKIEQILGEKDPLVGFINVNRLCITCYGITESESEIQLEKLYYELKKLPLSFRLSYSIPFQIIERFSQSYKDCDLALEISDKDQEIISFADIEAKALLYQIKPNIAERFSERIINNSILKYTETIECFFKKNLKIQQTADEMYIHRNTLIYRLNKIKEETGYDPKCFRDALTLQFAIWISHKNKVET
ncbi:sugar diacid recognition domain-containing protein [Pseudalkalibacillus hwajinpoensis]|uniref:CdaR family transcriptional regulator n=1 Tax=Guptibacillus hwajinpoensis TaxID=208199 RepID=UPI00325BBDF1